jgi:hypothetical protein
MFDKEVRSAIASRFIDSGYGQFWPPTLTGESHIVRWQARISGSIHLTCARCLEFASDGGIRYCEKIDRHESGDESVSDLFIQSVRFLKFAESFYSNRNYFGNLSVLHRIDCTSPVRFAPAFPDEVGNYVFTSAITFLGQVSGEAKGTSRIVRELSHVELGDPETVTCDFMLCHLRELYQANVAYEQLRSVVGSVPSVPGFFMPESARPESNRAHR